MHRTNTLNLGEFQEVDYNKYFSYRKTNDEYAVKHGLMHEIDVHDGVRYAIVKKTVAYVLVETHDGQMFLEKWNIKNHIAYNQV